MVVKTWPHIPTSTGISSSYLLPCPPPSPTRTAAPEKPFRVTLEARSSPSHPKPPPKRKNHLRPKLLRTLRTVPQPPNPPLLQTLAEGRVQTLTDESPTDRELVIFPSRGVPTGHLLVLEEDQVSESVHQIEVSDNLPAVAHHEARLLLELSLYFVALLAVQTVCAAWLFSGANDEDTAERVAANDAEMGDERKQKSCGELGGDKLDFEKKVAEIRAMAREVRGSEAQEKNDVVGVSKFKNAVSEEVNQRMGTMRKNLAKAKVLPEKNRTSDPRVETKGRNSSARRRPGLTNYAHAARNIPMGFNSSKSNTAPVKNLTNGDIQQIDYNGYLKDSLELHETTKSSFFGSDKTKRSSGSKDLTTASFKGCTGDPKVIGQETIERSESDRGISLSEMRHGNCEQGLHNIEVDKKAVINTTVRQQGSGNQLWWLKLPYVLAIFLRRGSDREGFKGLYSLMMGADRDDDSCTRTTVVFEDRRDATNFCYLLESFFEDLSDFSANIVPLSIQELNEAVDSRASKVVVVKKGQLQLYAGQPLTEAEMQLRSKFG